MKVEQDPITYYKRGIILNLKFPEKHLTQLSDTDVVFIGMDSAWRAAMDGF